MSAVDRFLDERHPHRQIHRVRCLTVSHAHTSADVRGRFALSEAERCRLYVRVRELAAATAAPGAEILLLDTCNRTEVYLAADTPDALDTLADIARTALAAVKGLTRDDLAHLRELSGVAVAQHLCEVAAGLQSVVLGETQILQQLKDAYGLAHGHEASGPVLHSLVHLAFKAGRRARSETGIADGQVSVASAGVEQAREFFGGSLAGRRVLLVGAGKIGRLTVARLVDAGVAHIGIANRTGSKADELAAEAARRGVASDVIMLDAVPAWLARVDLAITAVAECAAADHLLDAAALQPLRERATADPRPTLLVDLGMPANICASASELPGVTRVGIDELDRLTSGARQQREQHVPAVRAIIADELAALTDRDGAITGSVMAALYRRFSDITRCEVARQGEHGLPATEEELSGFALRLVRKLLAPVSQRYGSKSGNATLDELETLVALFALDLTDDSPAHTPTL